MNWHFERRTAGVLLPLSALPGVYGIGSLGKSAYDFIDFLSQAGQSYWQMLPIGPTGYGDSPYAALSSFAGNPNYVDLDLLCQDGLISASELATFRFDGDAHRIPYGKLFREREHALRIAFSRFSDWDALEQFRVRNIDWLEDYALFAAIKREQGDGSFLTWPEPLRLRQPNALLEARLRLKEDIQFNMFVQLMFFQQWEDMHRYAWSKNLSLIGDIPIYCAMDSADVWANSSCFLLDEQCRPLAVSGCPPDSFSAVGQLWGNPLYRWREMKKNGYAWWIHRLQGSTRLFDVMRIDHFRGLERYYAIPANAKDALKGKWYPGPGEPLVRAIRQHCPYTAFIAEDLGFLTPEVQQLLDFSDWPGMKVLQFAFDSREEEDYRPYHYKSATVSYPGTHDNDTCLGWGSTAAAEDVEQAMTYMGLSQPSQLAEGFVRLTLSSVSNLAIIPIQDWLGLDSRARINIPSTVGGQNWTWRLTGADLTDDLAAHIYQMTELYGRLQEEEEEEVDN